MIIMCSFKWQKHPKIAMAKKTPNSGNILGSRINNVHAILITKLGFQLYHLK